MHYPPENPAPSLPPKEREPEEAAAPEDLDAVRALLERARDFLDTCRRDPRQALEQEDPAELLAALDGARASVPATPAPWPTPVDEEVDDEVDEDVAGEELPEGEGSVIRHLHPRRSA